MIGSIHTILTVLPGLTMQGPQEKVQPTPIGWSSQLPPAASTFSSVHDPLYYFTYYMCVFFFVLITGILVYSVIKYRRRYEGQPPASMATHHTALEVTWTVVPLILVMIIFAWGFKGAFDMSKAPEDAITYEVTGKQWSWSIRNYPGDSTLDNLTNTFYVPVDTPVLFYTHSEDVLHSLYLPAMRAKRDVLPGRYQTMWFQAKKGTEGSYPFFCTEYCGAGHSTMIGTFHVLSKEEFEKRPWRQLPKDPATGEVDAVAAGKIFYEKCQSCHTVDGNRAVGPSFKDLYGKTETVLVDGGEQQVKIDDDYIIESIRQPQKKIVKGYEKENMTPFSEAELPEDYIRKYLIAYLKSISKHAGEQPR